MNRLYDLLAQLGYTHPLHPAFTHIPVGAVMVAFFLTLTALLTGRRALLTSAHHCLVVGFVMLIPTIAVGILDWQHYYAGAWIYPFQIKIPLAATLFMFMLLTLLVGRNPGRSAALMLAFYLLCLFNVIGLGYLGGELVFADHKISTNSLGDEILAGQQIFASHCAGCHVNGGNVIFPDLPLYSAPQLKSFETFIAFVRNPTLRNGKKGPMPDFTVDKLTEQEARVLHRYLVNSWVKPTR